MDPSDPIPTFIMMQQDLRPAQLRRRQERLFRILLWVLAGIAGVFMLLGIAALRFDPNAHRTRIEALVGKATGRSFHIDGGIAIASYRHMTFVANKVRLGNVAGGARPDMLSVGRVEADLLLWPLLRGRIEIARMVAEDADLSLETDAAGRGNWQFAPMRAPVPAGDAKAGAAGAAARRLPSPVLIRAVHVRDARVAWHNGRSGLTTDLVLRRFTSSENPRDGSVALGAELVLGAQSIVFNGQVSAFERLLDPDPAGPPWGGLLTAEIPGAKLTVTGTIEHPLTGAGYHLHVDGIAADMSGLANLLGRKLPPLRNVMLGAQIADGPSGAAEVSDLLLQVGTSDLDSLIPDLKVEEATLRAKTGSSPVRVEARGTLAGTEWRTNVDAGALDAVLDGRGGLPIDLAATLGDSTLSVKGMAPTPWSDARLDVGVQLRLRDLANLSPFVGHRLPRMRPVAFGGRLATTEGGGFALRDGRLVIPQADVAADADLTIGPRPSLHMFLHGDRLDADALIDTFSGISFAPPTNEIPLGALPIRRSIRPMISDAKLKLGWVDSADIDLSISVDQLTLGGMTARDIAGRGVTRDGRLSVHPLTGTLPGGPFSLALDLDTRAAPMPVALTVKAPAIDIRPTLQAFGRTDDISGLMEVDADLKGTGPSLHDIAGTLTGHLGLAMVDGQVDNAVMTPLLGGVMRAVRVPSDLLFGPGRSRVRCFALRLDAQNGHGTVPALALDVGRALIRGSGTTELGDETLDLRVRPLLRVTSAGISLPLKVTGRYRAVEVSVDQGATADAAVGALSALSGRMLGTVAPERDADVCPAALAVARGGQSPVIPAEPPPPPLLPLRAPSR